MEVLVRSLATGAILTILASQSIAQTGFLLATSLSPIIQNEQADLQGMTRVADEQTLQQFVRTQALVPVPANSRTYYLKGVPSRYSYLRPWSKRFLDHLGGQYHARFKDRLRVTSLVRTERLQLQLAGYNGNAAPASGPTQSSHLTGATLDISKAKMSAAQREWMRAQLVKLSDRGYLYGIEERVQPTFHIMVYKNFPGAGVGPAQVRPPQIRVEKASVRKSAKLQRVTKVRKASRKVARSHRVTRRRG